jgi:hypothetical protein
MTPTITAIAMTMAAIETTMTVTSSRLSTTSSAQLSAPEGWKQAREPASVH